MERLIVKHFGPIREIDIEIKDVNVLIGTTGSGKSTVAKLTAIFRSSEFPIDNLLGFKEALKAYNILFSISERTVIEYRNPAISVPRKIPGYWRLAKKRIDYQLDQRLSLDEFISVVNTTLDSIFTRFEGSHAAIADKIRTRAAASQREMHGGRYYPSPIYIPAERGIMVTLGRSIFSLLNTNSSIPYCLRSFGRQFENARTAHPTLEAVYI
ncbi:MAG: hypothetical protein AAF998_27955 [Bacteroidota bacterium]